MKKILLLGALALALAASLTGCGMAEPDGYVANVYIFDNKTADVVTLEVYERGELRHSWTIEAGESLRQSVADDDYRAYASIAAQSADLYTHTSVFDFSEARMVFGGAKELWFSTADLHTPYNIYDYRSYLFNSLNAGEMEWIYDIDHDVAAAATEIETKPEPEAAR